MSLRFIFGNSGAGKSHKLFTGVIKSSMENPGQRYLIIVPEQFTMQTQRELVRLHPDGGILDIDVLSFQRLAWRVFDETGTQTGTVLEETGKSLVLRRLAQDHIDELKVLGGGLRKSGYIGEIKSVISELSQYSVTEDDLEAFCEKNRDRTALYHKLSDILVIYKAFHEYLESGYVTAEGILEVLCRVAGRSDLIRGSVIAFDGFTGFTPIQNKLIGELLRCSKEVIVTVTVDVRENPFVCAGSHELFALSKKTTSVLTQLAGETGAEVIKPLYVDCRDKDRFSGAQSAPLRHLEQNIFRVRQTPYEGRPSDAVRLYLYKDPDAEVAAAAAQIQEMVRNEGLRYRDFAVITGDMEAYAPVLERILPRYGIPCFIDNKKNVGGNPFVDYVTALLEIAEQDFSYESMFRFLRGALTDLEPDETDVLENYVLASGIRGSAKWRRPFEKLAGGVDEEGLAAVNEIREKAVEGLPDFVKLQRGKNADVRTRTAALYEFIEKKRIQAKLAALEEEFKNAGDPVAAKEYHQIYVIVMNLFDKLVGFLGDEQVSLKEYKELLEAGFADAKVGVIPPGVDSMTAGDVERTRLGDIKVLFFLGVNEGSIPKAASGGGLLSDTDRETLKDGGLELSPTQREKAYIDRFYLYLAVTKPSKRLILSCTSLDVEGRSIRPSYLINMTAGLFPGLALERGASADAGQVPQNEAEAVTLLAGGLGRLRGGDTENEKTTKRLYRYFAGRPECGEKLGLMLDAAFGIHEDTCLGRAAAQALYGNELRGSVTRFETYASCPYRHFLGYGLRLSERETFEFKPVDVGNVFHDAIEAFSERLKASGYDWRNIPLETADAWAGEVMSGICAEYGNQVLGSTARDAYTVERLERMLKRTVRTLKEQIGSGEFEPELFEEVFSSTVKLDGGAMKLRGRIDRLDLCEKDGKLYIKVVDYKTGSKKFSLRELNYGITLQLPLYLDAALEMMRRKYPGRETEAAAVLYYQVQDPILDAEDGENDDTAERAMLEALRPDGLVSSDPEIIRLLDRGIKGKSQVIPVTLNKDGTVGSASKVADAGQFDTLTRFVEKKVREIGSEILVGHKEVSPYESKGGNACGYCGYRAVCGRDAKRGGFAVRRLPAFPDRDIWQMMEDALQAESKDPAGPTGVI